MTKDQKQTEQTAQAVSELPPLPRPKITESTWFRTDPVEDAYTADQMRAVQREAYELGLSQVRGKAQEPDQAKSAIMNALARIAYLAGDIDDDTLHNEIKEQVRLASDALFAAAPQVAQEEEARGPDKALLISMACCLNHGFGMESKQRQGQYLYDMRKLYDEVAGNGYYKPENRERYLAMLNDEDYQSPSDKLKGFFAAAPQPDAQQSNINLGDLQDRICDRLDTIAKEQGNEM